MTCYLTRSTGSDSLDSPNPRFRIRYFTPFAEIELCGHATLAAAHALLSFGLLDSHIIEFVTPSNILTAKKFPETKASESSNIQNGEAQECFLIELNFPTVPTIDFSSVEVSSISSALNGASVIDIKKTTIKDILFVVLPSGESVVEIQPVFDAICKCPGMGIIVSGAAPSGSGFDFYSLFFCPKLGINEHDLLRYIIQQVVEGTFVRLLFVEMHIVPWHHTGARNWGSVILLRIRHHLEVEC
nr:uncharacterized protein LOC111994041 isoform X2 [Quercus suber]POE73995.1 putative isomerase [Quercus suber]